MENLKKTAMIILCASGYLGFSSLEAQAKNGDFPPYWGWHPMWGGFGGVFMMIFMFLFWAALIVGIILFIRWMFTGKPVSFDKGETALDILKKRYASGEIDQEEFETRKKHLE